MLRAQDARVAMNEVVFGPMLEAPVTWTSPINGGYETIPQVLVKGAQGERLSNLLEHDMPEVYKAVNRLQSVGLKIVEDTFEVAMHFWNDPEDFGLDCIPDRNETPCPAFPVSLEGKRRKDLETEEELALWNQATDMRREWHKASKKQKSEVMMAHSTLTMAEELIHETKFFTPMQLDFRGRVYCSSQFNFQSNKLMRGLIAFADGAPLTEAGVDPFCIHGANCWGMDKAPMSERIAWVYENKEWIMAVAEDPIMNFLDAREKQNDPDTGMSMGGTWADAEEPWAFLSWALEAGEWLSQGCPTDFVSHQPIASDSTCSSVQHVSMLLADARGGQEVNLTAGDRRDVYLSILDRCLERLREAAEGGDQDAAFLLRSPYLKGKNGRKACKPCGMVRLYNCSPRSIYDGLRLLMADIDNCISIKNYQPQDQYNPNAIARYLGDHILESTDEVLAGLASSLEFFKSVAAVSNELGLQLRWTTPTGFLVQHDYFKHDLQRITTHLNGNLYTPSYAKQTDKLDKVKIINAVSANIIHSLDGSLLQMAVNRADVDCITVHDSFAVRACDAQLMVKTLKECMADMYEPNLLVRWFNEVLPEEATANAAPDILQMIQQVEIPERGDLDIRAVLDSEYAFS